MCRPAPRLPLASIAWKCAKSILRNKTGFVLAFAHVPPTTSQRKAPRVLLGSLATIPPILPGMSRIEPSSISPSYPRRPWSFAARLVACLALSPAFIAGCGGDKKESSATATGLLRELTFVGGHLELGALPALQIDPALAIAGIEAPESVTLGQTFPMRVYFQQAPTQALARIFVMTKEGEARISVSSQVKASPTAAIAPCEVLLPNLSLHSSVPPATGAPRLNLRWQFQSKAALAVARRAFVVHANVVLIRLAAKAAVAAMRTLYAHIRAPVSRLVQPVRHWRTVATASVDLIQSVARRVAAAKMARHVTTMDNAATIPEPQAIPRRQPIQPAQRRRRQPRRPRPVRQPTQRRARQIRRRVQVTPKR